MPHAVRQLPRPIARPWRVLVIRLGHLGDLLLTLPALRHQKRLIPARELIVVTRRAYIPLLQCSTVIDRVLAWEDVSTPAQCWSLARTLLPDEVWDLQGSPRTRLWTGLLTLAWSQAYVRRPERDFLNRRAVLQRGWQGVLARWLLGGTPPLDRARRQQWERVLGLAAASPPPADPEWSAAEKRFEAHPWRAPAPANGEFLMEPEPHVPEPLTATTARAGTALLPGARHATKRWPLRHWQTLALALCQAGESVWVLGGPADAPLLKGLSEACPQVQTLEADAAALLPVLASFRCAVGQDSGLTHLAESAGTPVLMLLGPTVAAFGFSPSLSDSVIVQQALACRPCSLHGERHCPLGHHACLEGLAPERVLNAWQRLHSRLGTSAGARDDAVGTAADG